MPRGTGSSKRHLCCMRVFGCARPKSLLTLFPGLKVHIKWPNDVYVNRRKVAGMIFPATTSSAECVGRLGVGINVAATPSGSFQSPVTSLADELRRPVSREEVLAAFANALELQLAAPPADVIADYRDRSFFQRGDLVAVYPRGVEAAERHFAVVEEIEPTGLLRVKMTNGQVKSLAAEEVSIRPPVGPDEVGVSGEEGPVRS